MGVMTLVFTGRLYLVWYHLPAVPAYRLDMPGHAAFRSPRCRTYNDFSD